MAACLRGFEVDTELDLTDNEYSDVEDKFQDLLVDRRSLNLYQSSSLEGKNFQYEIFLGRWYTHFREKVVSAYTNQFIEVRRTEQLSMF